MLATTSGLRKDLCKSRCVDGPSAAANMILINPKPHARATMAARHRKQEDVEMNAQAATHSFNRQVPALRRGLSAAVVLSALSALLLGGCAIEFQNKQGAKEIAEAAKLPGSVATGWRVFQDNCAACHGAAATGTVKAPDLLPRVREMGADRFTNLVLKRYDWSASTGSGNAAGLSTRPIGQAFMPAWQSDPVVNAHIVDLYAYLSARSEGTQGPGQPLR